MRASLLFLLLGSSAALALEVKPPNSIGCFATKTDEVLTSATVALMDGNTQRRSATRTSFATGEHVVTFSRSSTPMQINGIRIACTFQTPAGSVTHETTHKISPIAIPANDAPMVRVRAERRDSFFWLTVAQ